MIKRYFHTICFSVFLLLVACERNAQDLSIKPQLDSFHGVWRCSSISGPVINTYVDRLNIGKQSLSFILNKDGSVFVNALPALRSNRSMEGNGSGDVVLLNGPGTWGLVPYESMNNSISWELFIVTKSQDVGVWFKLKKKRDQYILDYMYDLDLPTGVQFIRREPVQVGGQ